MGVQDVKTVPGPSCGDAGPSPDPNSYKDETPETRETVQNHKDYLLAGLQVLVGVFSNVKQINVGSDPMCE